MQDLCSYQASSTHERGYQYDERRISIGKLRSKIGEDNILAAEIWAVESWFSAIHLTPELEQSKILQNIFINVLDKVVSIRLETYVY